MADRETFDRIRANTLEGVEPPDFDRLVDRAGRRRRRQTAVALAGAAVAVIAVVAATFQIGDPDRTQPPVDRPDLRLPATLDVGDAPGTPLVLEGLTQGSAPKVPWVEGDVFHGEAGDITLPGDQVSVRKFVALGDGVAQLVGPGAARVQLVSLEGDVFDEFAGSGILGSPDGGSLAWFDPASREAVLTSSQGEQTDRVPVPGTGDFVPVGWLDDNDVVLAPSDATRGRPSAWRTSGEPASWALGSVETTSPERGLVAGRVGRRPDLPDCIEVFAADRPARPVWHHCYELDRQAYALPTLRFSPSGSVLAVHSQNGTGERGYLAILDARDGSVAASLDLGHDESQRVRVVDFRFEDSDHLLLVVEDGTGEAEGSSQVAIVRCTIEVRCELAATPVRTSVNANSYLVPYRLVG